MHAYTHYLLLFLFFCQVGARRSGGHNSPDVGEEMVFTTDSGNSAPKVGTEVGYFVTFYANIPYIILCTMQEHDMGLATNPQNAFTLDISSDRNKVKLHLNRALIKRVLHDNKLNTVERRKARRQVSQALQPRALIHSFMLIDIH